MTSPTTRRPSGLLQRISMIGAQSPPASPVGANDSSSPIADGARKQRKRKPTSRLNCYINVELRRRAAREGLFKRNTASAAPEPTPTIEIRLFDSELPRTCDNFRKLCEKKVYETFIFDEISLDYMRTGAITENGSLGNLVQIGDYREAKENPEIPLRSHNQVGLLSALRSSSKFIITSKPVPALDKDYVVFGEVVEGPGLDFVKSVMKEYGTIKGEPKEKIVITDCGLFFGPIVKSTALARERAAAAPPGPSQTQLAVVDGPTVILQTPKVPQRLDQK